MAHGGKRAGAGRKPGVVSKAKRELAEMAQDHAEDALSVLVSIMRSELEPGSTRVSASTAILDRAYGRPTQMVIGAGGNGEHLHKVGIDPKRLSDAALAELIGAMNANDETDAS